MFKVLSLKKNLIAASCAVVIASFSFQNCGQNMTTLDSTLGTGADTTQADSTTSLVPCVAEGCPQSAEYIQLAIANNDPIGFLVNAAGGAAEGVVDVAGFCNIAGYPSSHLYYSVSDDAGNAVVGTTLASGTCDITGRFSFPVTIAALAANKNYHISVLLKAVDSTGAEFESPLGRNRKQVGLSPRTGS